MYVETMAFGCPRCGAQLTEWLRPWPFADDVRTLQSEVPIGTWARRESPQRSGFPIAVHLHATHGLTMHPEPRRSIGCCGISYRDGQPNLVCTSCGEEAGYRLSDGDHCVHGVFLRDHVVDRQRVDLPVVSSAVRVPAGAPATGFAALHDRFAVPEDVCWESDASYALEGRQAVELVLSVRDGRIEMAVDGLVVAPPWPTSEQRRLRQLGAVAEGTPDEPVTWWFVPEGTAHAEERAARHDWMHWRDGRWMGLGWEHRGQTVGVKVRHDRWRRALTLLAPRAVL